MSCILELLVDGCLQMHILFFILGYDMGTTIIGMRTLGVATATWGISFQC